MGTSPSQVPVKLTIMQFLVLLSTVALAYSAPQAIVDVAPAALPYVHDATGDVAVDDSMAAVPYVHDATGEVAEAYVHAEIPAEAYVHDAAGEVAEPYVHQEIPAEPYVEAVAAPVVYAAYPAQGYSYYPYGVGAAVAAPVTASKAVVTYANTVPATPVTTNVNGGVTYAANTVAHPYYATYPYAAVHTGCVNSVGSVVPCA